MCGWHAWFTVLLAFAEFYTSSLSYWSKTGVPEASTIRYLHKFDRQLGAYEQLLARTAQGTNSLALSHAVCYILTKPVSNELLVGPVARCIERHPQLRSCIYYKQKNLPHWHQSTLSSLELAASVLNSTRVDNRADFDKKWRTMFDTALNSASFPATGPLWRLHNIQLPDEKSAWVFCSNHAIGDQKSFNIVVSELLADINGLGDSRSSMKVHPFPLSVEQAVAPGPPGCRTLLWAAVQAWNSISRPTLVPKHVLQRIKGRDITRSYYEKVTDPSERRTFTRQFKLTTAETARLRNAVKQQPLPTSADTRRLTVTDALSAAMVAVANVVLQDSQSPLFASGEIAVTKLRFLLAVGLRSYGNATAEYATKGDYTGGTVASASGAVDYIISSSQALSRSSLSWAAAGTADPPGLTDEFRQCFWEVAAQCRERSENLLRRWQLVPESVRLFHIGMRLQEAGYADILRAVEIDAHNPRTLGRGYTCGVSNMGVAKFSSDLPAIKSNDPATGAVGVEEAYFATSHGRNGVLYQLSCMTVQDRNSDRGAGEGALCGCLQFTSPITTEEEADYFLDKLVFLLRNI